MAKMTHEQFREKILIAVKAKLEHEPWFRGVCLDDIDECFPDLEEGIDMAYCNTLYWDAPNHGM